MARTTTWLLAAALLAPGFVTRPAAAQSTDPLSPADVAKLFEAYAVVQAQEMLGLDEAQYGRFVPRYRALIEVRRRGLNARLRAVQELNRLTKTEVPVVDETRVRDLIAGLADSDARTAGEVQTALSAVDEVLTLRQRARFRVFEEQMERRKVELMIRARQNTRSAAPRHRP
jgi:hypothetical protein